MADCLTSRSLPVAVLALLASGEGSCFGQGDSSLADPMRPPIVAAESAPGSSEGLPPPSGLQTIITGKGRKPMAIINGTAVGIGEKVGEARLVKLSETQAVLQGPGGKEILYLTPGVEKMDSLTHQQGVEQKRQPSQKPVRPEATP